MFKNVFKHLIKEDPFETSFENNLLYNETPVSFNKQQLMLLYKTQCNLKKEDEFVKLLIDKFQKKKSMTIKLKILLYLFYISKESQYDICEILMSKKIKIFSQQSVKKKITHTFELVESNRQDYIHKYLIIPLYNYMIKFSVNEQLYNICEKQQVPDNEIFRKGSKIRHIWLFKIYNLINLLIPIFTPLIILIQNNNNASLYIQILSNITQDISIYVNFISNCIEQTLGFENPMLMPYSECLQLFQCLKQYDILRQRIQKLRSVVKKYVQVKKIKFVKIDEKIYRQIQILAMRVKLISASLRNNNNPKQNLRLATEYNQKCEVYEIKLKTQADQFTNQ